MPCLPCLRSELAEAGTVGLPDWTTLGMVSVQVFSPKNVAGHFGRNGSDSAKVADFTFAVPVPGQIGAMH